jgi:hypothetical protein
MKRSQGFDPRLCIRLNLPLEELRILLGDDEMLLEKIGTELLNCKNCGLHPLPDGEVDLYLDEDNCLYLVKPCIFCQQGDCLGFIDTTDLPDWQHILRHLLRQQFGLNSLGDE